MQGGVDHIGRIAQRLQHLGCRFDVLENQCRRRVVCQHFCLHAAGVDQGKQAEHKTADDDAHRDKAHRKHQRQAVDVLQLGTELDHCRTFVARRSSLELRFRRCARAA